MPDSRDRSLFQAGLVALVATCVYFTLTSSSRDPLVVGSGLVILTLASAPSLQWARRRSKKIPAFEILMLNGITFYALPVLQGHPQIIAAGDEVVLKAAGLLVVYQISAITVYALTHGRPARSSLWTRRVAIEDRHALPHVALWVGATYQFIAAFTDSLPMPMISLLRAAFTGAALVSVLVLYRLWGFGRLQREEKLSAVVGLGANIVPLLGSLYLQSALSFATLALIGYVASSHRVPVVALAVLVPIFGVLHLGKFEMRRLYWEVNPRSMSAGEMPALLFEWAGAGLHELRMGDGDSQSRHANFLERASLMQMMCLCSRRIPAEIPFLQGASYADLPAQLVPSLLWTDKVSPHASNERLALHLGLVNESNVSSVSIAFGMPAEAYVNFGVLGVAALGATLGYIYKRVVTLAQQASILSPVGLSVVLLTAWSFQSELVVASWVSSLLQALALVVGVPVALRSSIAHDQVA